MACGQQFTDLQDGFRPVIEGAGNLAAVLMRNWRPIIRHLLVPVAEQIDFYPTPESSHAAKWRLE
jgi:hypothetical protein